MKLSTKIGLAIMLSAFSCTKEGGHISSRTSTQSLNNSVTTKVHVGDTLGGGIVFYVDSTRVHGLIAAVADQGRIRWYNGAFTVTGAKGKKIGTGADNTQEIINSQGAGGYAATLCVTYRGGGYTDWFLPSKAELGQLYKHKDVINGLSNFFYWSSTEVDSTKAWSMSFYSGTYSEKSKGGQLDVRAIRTF